MSVVVLRLDAPGAYPLLLGRPWLRTANIKQHWQHNMISFRRGKAKVRIITEARTSTPSNNNPLYEGGVHMLDGLANDKINTFLDEHPTIVPLFEIDVLSAIEPYLANTINHEAPHEPDQDSVKELQQARDAVDCELAISQRVKASTLEEVNLCSLSEPRQVKIAKDLAINDRSTLLGLLTEYQDVFTWAYNDMKGLDPQYYQHQIHLQKDAWPIQQRRYRMNPNYTAKVKDELYKLLNVGFIWLVVKSQG